MRAFVALAVFAALGDAQAIAIKAGRMVDLAGEPSVSLNQVIIIEKSRQSGRISPYPPAPL